MNDWFGNQHPPASWGFGALDATIRPPVQASLQVAPLDEGVLKRRHGTGGYREIRPLLASLDGDQQGRSKLSDMILGGEADRIVEEIRRSGFSGPRLRNRAMELLSELPNNDWCGVYRLEADELILDEYVGAATDHARIPIGQGVCGTAVSEGRNQVIDDVRGLSNYLSCSRQTRSEIVVLIWRHGQIVGQIDIDGHTVGAFDKSDERFLERVAEVLASRWE